MPTLGPMLNIKGITRSQRRGCRAADELAREHHKSVTRAGKHRHRRRSQELSDRRSARRARRGDHSGITTLQRTSTLTECGLPSLSVSHDAPVS